MSSVPTKYPVDEAYTKSNRLKALSVVPLVILVIFVSTYLELLDYGYVIQNMLIGMVIMFCFQLFQKPEEAAYAIEDDRLRISPSYAYPIENITEIHLRKIRPDVFQLKIIATEMDNLRTPPLRNGDKLAQALQSKEPQIELAYDPKET